MVISDDAGEAAVVSFSNGADGGHRELRMEAAQTQAAQMSISGAWMCTIGVGGVGINE